MLYQTYCDNVWCIIHDRSDVVLSYSVGLLITVKIGKQNHEYCWSINICSLRVVFTRKLLYEMFRLILASHVYFFAEIMKPHTKQKFIHCEYLWIYRRKNILTCSCRKWWYIFEFHFIIILIYTIMICN